MKYKYAYKTSDGIRHEASIEAESRDAAFTLLRGKGIRPIKVIAADGSKENGAIYGVRTRSVVFIALSVALLVGIVASFLLRAKSQIQPGFLREQTRRQVIGDSAIIDKGIATGWADIFPEEGERFFASFAIPGVKAGLRNSTVEELEKALKRRIEALPEDGMEARQIKSMVEGMKAEARAYVKAGGNLLGYGKRLVERQEKEIAIYERTKLDLEKASKDLSKDEYLALWEEKNKQLRNMGIKLIPLEDF